LDLVNDFLEDMQIYSIPECMKLGLNFGCSLAGAWARIWTWFCEDKAVHSSLRAIVLIDTFFDA
jgi:hypothetical protein